MTVRPVTLEEIFAPEVNEKDKEANLLAFLLAHKNAVESPTLANIALAAVGPSLEKIVLGAILMLRENLLALKDGVTESGRAFLDKTNDLTMTSERASLSLHSACLAVHQTSDNLLMRQLQPWFTSSIFRIDFSNPDLCGMNPSWVIRLILCTVDLTENERATLLGISQLPNTTKQEQDSIRDKFSAFIAELVRIEYRPSEFLALVYDAYAKWFFSPRGCLVLDDIKKLSQENTSLNHLKKALIYVSLRERAISNLDLFSVKIIDALDEDALREITRKIAEYDRSIKKRELVFDVKKGFDAYDKAEQAKLTETWAAWVNEEIPNQLTFHFNAPSEAYLNSPYTHFFILFDRATFLLKRLNSIVSWRDPFIKIATSLLNFRLDSARVCPSLLPTERELTTFMRVVYLKKGGDSDRAEEIFFENKKLNKLSEVRRKLQERVTLISGASEKTLKFCKALLEKYDSVVQQARSSAVVDVGFFAYSGQNDGGSTAGEEMQDFLSGDQQLSADTGLRRV